MALHELGDADLIRAVELIEAGGTSHLIWSGADPSTGYGLGSFVLNFEETAYDIASIRIYVDASAGTPQIDAVQLLTGGDAEETVVSSWSFGLQSTETIYTDDGKVDTENIFTRGGRSNWPAYSLATLS